MKNKKIIILVIITILFVGVIYVINSSTKQNVPPPVTTKSYTDPRNQFSITVPENWKYQANTGLESYSKGALRGSSHPVEVVHLYAQKNVGVTVQVIEGKPSCEKVPTANSTLAGLPATYIPEDYRWKLFTEDASYTVSYFYPGAGKFHGPHKTVASTPVPQADMDANKKTVDAVIKSFLPKNLKPLKC